MPIVFIVYCIGDLTIRPIVFIVVVYCSIHGHSDYVALMCNSQLFQLIPPLPAECVEIDEDLTTMPIVFIVYCIGDLTIRPIVFIALLFIAVYMGTVIMWP